MSPNFNNPLARERRLHLVVSVLTLVTAGLLSSVGLGLHEWFGCTHSCSTIVSPADTSSDTPAFESAERCALCDLLSQYRFVRVPAPEVAHGPYLPATLRPEAKSRLWAFVATWPAPRGPPLGWLI
jgi:hypothetical protein